MDCLGARWERVKVVWKCCQDEILGRGASRDPKRGQSAMGRGRGTLSLRVELGPLMFRGGTLLPLHHTDIGYPGEAGAWEAGGVAGCGATSLSESGKLSTHFRVSLFKRACGSGCQEVPSGVGRRATRLQRLRRVLAIALFIFSHFHLCAARNHTPDVTPHRLIGLIWLQFHVDFSEVMTRP
jgi:hypothetical protein